MKTDSLHVVHARAAGLDVHKMQITASVRICAAGGEPRVETRTFDALASGLDEMIAWMRACEVDAAVMEGTGIYWLAPFEALEAAGIPATLVKAQQVKQLKGRKSDVADSVWLARVCQFALASPSYVPPKAFQELRVLTRYRRTLISQRSRVRNRVQKVLDRRGAHVGGVLSDVFGRNGRRILDGLVEGLDREAILASLSHHVQHKTQASRRCAAAFAERYRRRDAARSVAGSRRSGRTHRGARWRDRAWPYALAGPHRAAADHSRN